MPIPQIVPDPVVGPLGRHLPAPPGGRRIRELAQHLSDEPVGLGESPHPFLANVVCDHGRVRQDEAQEVATIVQV